MQMFSLALNRLCSIVKMHTKMRKILILRLLLHEQEGKGDKKRSFLDFYVFESKVQDCLLR